MRWQRAYSDPTITAHGGPFRLKSDLHPESPFTAEMTARWSGPDDGTAVFRYLVDTASRITENYSVLDAGTVEIELNHEFAAVGEMPGTGATLITAHATLTIANDDLDYAERRTSIHRETLLADADLAAQRDRLLRLREVFLGDPATARLWWFNGEPGKLLALTDKDGQFETVVQSIAGSHSDSADQDALSGIIHQFLTELGPESRTFLLGQLAKVFASYERPDLVAALGMLAPVDRAIGPRAHAGPTG